MHKKLQMPIVYPVTCHTDHVGPGSTFVAIKGFNHDGVQFIVDAIQKGAATVVVQKDAVIADSIMDEIQKANVSLVYVENTRKELALLSARAAGYPAHKLRIIGITGTKGKTTTSFILAHILQKNGYKTALLSTVKNMINAHEFPASLTTAQPDYLHQFLKLCVEYEIEYVVIEVAAQAHTLHRIEGILFDGIIFTNFALEHLEFYPNMEAYFAAKCAIVQQRKPQAPLVLNIDDSSVCSLSSQPGVVSFGINAGADFVAEVYDVTMQQVRFLICGKYDTDYPLLCPALLGLFNVYNVLAASTMAYAMGISIPTIAHAVQSFSGVSGRLERYELPNGAVCIIDYAHNPQSYEAVLGMLREMTDSLIVVFGAGGQRDPNKRPVMGDIASRIADVVILTTDNPRAEDPTHIINDIEQGIAQEFRVKVIREIDRKKAIEKAYQIARRGSIIALLGKGAETYQIIGTTKHYFCESAIVKALQ